MEIKGTEVRNVQYRVVADTEKRTVEGYAALFNTPSDGLYFGTEIIEPGAFDGVLERSDVFALLNHDMNRGVLGRWKKGEVSLRLSIDEKGLKYSFEAPKTALGDELLENIRRGEVDESSFAFTVKKDTWERISDDKMKRTIQEIDELFDVSPVYAAAYSSTSVYLRAKENTEAIVKEQRERFEEEKRKQAEAELATYWEKVNKQFNL